MCMYPCACGPLNVCAHEPKELVLSCVFARMGGTICEHTGHLEGHGGGFGGVWALDVGKEQAWLVAGKGCWQQGVGPFVSANQLEAAAVDHAGGIAPGVLLGCRPNGQ